MNWAAASLIALLAPGPARADYFAYSGDVLVFPPGAPFSTNVNSPVIGLGPALLAVGNSGDGSFSAMAGAQVAANGLLMGTDLYGNGVFTADGANTLVTLLGPGGYDNRLNVGNRGTAVATVSGGAVIDAAYKLAGCQAYACQSVVAQTSGATGTLTITGARSRVATADLTIAGGYVGTDNNNNPYGVPGGTSNGTVNVLAGGALSTQATSVGILYGGPLALGTEQAVGSVLVDGPGSVWNVGAATVDGGPASLTLGASKNAIGILAVSQGGRVAMDGSGGTLYVGHSGQGQLLLTGASSVDAGPQGSVIVAAHAGSANSVLGLAGKSSLSAGDIAVSPNADSEAGFLQINDSTVTAQTLRIGPKGTVSGDQGVINAQVINAGTLLLDPPPAAPGTLTINGRYEGAPGGRIVFDIAADGQGGFTTSHLVFTAGSSYDFTAQKIEFDFLGAVDPKTFAASGQFNLDTFLNTLNAGVSTGLSTTFAPGQTYATWFGSSQFSFSSDTYSNLDYQFSADGAFSAAAVPEPQSWLYLLTGLGLVGSMRRRRRWTDRQTDSKNRRET